MALSITVGTDTERQAPPAAAGVSDPTQVDSTTRVTVDPASGADKAPPQEAPPEKLFAGKYKSVEEMESAYVELQKKFSSAPAAETKETPKDAPVAAPDAARKVVESAGLDIAALNEEYLASQSLSDETLKALEAKGISRETVESYIEGQKARLSDYGRALHKAVGGEDTFTQLLAWAGANMSEGEVRAINGALSSFDTAQAGVALAGLQARYVAANGKAPQLVTGGTPVRNAGVKPFASNAEVTAAMGDKRYKQGDPAFHKLVADRLAASDNFKMRTQ